MDVWQGSKYPSEGCHWNKLVTNLYKLKHIFEYLTERQNSISNNIRIEKIRKP